MLQIHGVSKRYGGVEALRGVDLTVASGQIVGLIGPNGAGKTTLMSVVTGLRQPDRGKVFVADARAGSAAVRSGGLLGYVPQDTGICPVVSVRANMRLFGALAGLRRELLHERILSCAQSLGLTSVLDENAGTLSGGQKRRLHVAMGLLHRPPLLLLDEPTTAADVETRGQILRLLRDLAASGTAILLSTHYLEEVEKIADDVVILHQGEVVAHGNVPALISQHGSSSLDLTFDGAAPIIEGAEIDGRHAAIATDDPAVAAARVLTSLGRDASRIQSIEIHRPNLDGVYLKVTSECRQRAEAPLAS